MVDQQKVRHKYPRKGPGLDSMPNTAETEEALVDQHKIRHPTPLGRAWLGLMTNTI